MPHYKLIPSGRPDLKADEIILKRDDSGEVQCSIHTNYGSELSEDLLKAADSLAERIGYKIVEINVPDKKSEQSESSDVGKPPVISSEKSGEKTDKEEPKISSIPSKTK